MDPITVVLTALGAGAVAALHDTAAQAVKDTYAGLKSLVQKRLAGKPPAETALAEYEQDPDTWEKPLRKALSEAGADKDEALVRQAQQVLKLVHPEQTAQGKYIVQIGEGKGIVIGDHAHVDQKFGSDC